jgi:hypothetical protein
MVLQHDIPNEQKHERHSRSHSHRKSRKPSFFLKIISGIQSLARFLTGSKGHKHHKSKRPPLSQRLKYRFEEFKNEFTPPERLKRGRIKHEPLGQRIKSRLKDYKDDVFLPRIKKEKLPKPKLSVRVGMKLDEVKDDLTFRRLFPKVGDHIPFRAKIAYLRETKWKQYSVIFSRDYLIISFNSLILFLCAFYVVHFLTQLITGLTCLGFDIQTRLYYGITEYHFTIKSIIEGQTIMNKWTLPEIITVFSSAPLACLLLAILSYRLLYTKRIKFSFKWISRKFKKLFANKLKKKELKIQEAEDPGRKVKLSKYLRLFLIWFICHAFAYFFSGMLFSWLFFMRFGYVTGYIFDSYFFDNLAASLSLISMVLLGFLFVSLFLHSSRMYFNQLVDWTRMPFVFSQILIPCILGLPIIVMTLLPKIILKVAAMQVCMIILVLPLMWRGRIYPEVQFDYKPRKIEIPWRWIISCLVISAAIITSLKFGIKIR